MYPSRSGLRVRILKMLTGTTDGWKDEQDKFDFYLVTEV